jgi:formylglycine-generating enzyme required for sulfatase activity
MFNRTYNSLDDGGAIDAGDPATVSAFRLDKYEITVGRFRQFVNAVVGGWRPAVGSGKHTHLNGGSGLVDPAGGYESGWQSAWSNDLSPAKVGWDSDLTGCVGDVSTATYYTWTSAAGSMENMPINCIDWYDAYAFCIWDNGFLPSEAEWEFAAAGGSEDRAYPWGGTFPGSGTATEFKYAISNCDYPDFSGPFQGACGGNQNIAVVGFTYLGGGKWGQLDLAGNMFEWNLDSLGPYTGCTNCAAMQADGGPTLRGGAYNATDLSPATRDSVPDPTWRYESIGARCARLP